MSNQEQQFYSAEHNPASVQRSYQYYPTSDDVNVDPREQLQQEMYGEPEYSTSRGEKLQPHSPNRKGFRALWLLPIVLFFLIGGMSYGLFAPHEQFAPQFDHGGFNNHFSRGDFDNHFVRPDPQQVFNVGDTPTLIINATEGTVHIHSDENSSTTKTVSVIVNQNDRGNPDSNPNVTSTQTANTITVTENSQGFEDNNASIDITTPKSSNVQLNDSNGNVTIEGVTGTIEAQTSQGNINADSVNGQVTLSSNNGDISFTNGSLSGQSSLHSDSGDIFYSGSIASQGSYKFDTTNGSVYIGLPSDSAFHFDVLNNNNYENEFGGNNIGNAPRANLTVSASGSIHISKNG